MPATVTAPLLVRPSRLLQPTARSQFELGCRLPREGTDGLAPPEAALNE